MEKVLLQYSPWPKMIRSRKPGLSDDVSHDYQGRCHSVLLLTIRSNQLPLDEPVGAVMAWSRY